MEKEMNKKKYKLTISILASNRKDTLPKTLESLKPILDNVSSELIVVDTGCDEDLLEIVRQYTYKIEKFEWCKDFAKARNVGIDKAQGDWFMFIDDDEWFEDVTEFIEFFNSDEMYKYNYAKYVVRNYENMEGTVWTDSIAGRMFRMFDGTRFIDAVHERPTHIAGPTKSFAAYAHHYGYVFKTEEDKRAHIKRNTDLLLEQIKREPGIARHYCHLTQEYNTIREYQKSLEYALEGIDKADMTVTENAKDIVGLYATVIWNMLNQLRYEEVLEKSNEYLKAEYMNELGSMALVGFCSTAAYKLERYEESVNYSKKFFEYNDLLTENFDLRCQQDAVMITSCLVEDNLNRIASVGFAASVKLANEQDIVLFTEKMENQIKSIIDAENCIKALGDVLAKTKEYEMCAKVIKTVMYNEAYFLILLNRIEKMREEDMDSFLNVADSMALVESNHGYVQFMNIISNRNADIGVLEKLYEKAIYDINDIVNLHHQFWSIAAQRQVNIASIVDKKPVDRWMTTVDSWAKNARVKDLIEKKQDLSALFDNSGIHMKYFDMVLVENLMYRKKLEGVSVTDIRNEMIRFTNVVMEFYRMIYKDNIFVECPTILPIRCQVALKFLKVLSGDKVDEKKELNSAADMMPGIRKMMDIYLEQI